MNTIGKAEWILGGVVLIGILWLLQKGNAAKVGAAAGAAAVDLATGTAAGAITAVGATVGIPETSASQCRVDLLNGDSWAASFSCPASDFLAYQLHGTIPAQ